MLVKFTTIVQTSRVNLDSKSWPVTYKTYHVSDFYMDRKSEVKTTSFTRNYEPEQSDRCTKATAQVQYVPCGGGQGPLAWLFYVEQNHRPDDSYWNGHKQNDDNAWNRR